jgi:hypothetical protein
LRNGTNNKVIEISVPTTYQKIEKDETPTFGEMLTKLKYMLNNVDNHKHVQ